MARFTLYINFKEITAEYPLPAVNDRSVLIDMSGIISGCLLSLEVYDNIWNVKADNNIIMKYNNAEFTSHILSDGDIIQASLSNGEKFVIMVYETTPFITEFTKYDLRTRTSFTVGKSENNDICVSDRFISTDHAVFSRSGEKWIITDKSSNGTYINGTGINGSLEIKMFDIIYTVGFKMVFLGECIALNRSDIVKCRLPLFEYKENKKGGEIISAENEDIYFSRSPRIMEPLFDEVTEIEGPPVPQKRRDQPLLFVIGPSVTMPLPILMSTLINWQSGAFRWGSLISVGVSAVIGAGWGMAHRVYNKKVMREDEEERAEAYKDYISKNENLLSEKHNYNSSILMTQFLSSENIVDKLLYDNTFIWNRNVNHDDFLDIRIGTGLIKFMGDIAVPRQRFSVHKDPLSDMPHKIKEKYEYMQNSVSVLKLQQYGIIGMIGNSTLINETAAGIIVQTAALHCYTDVKIAMLFTEKENAEFGWVRWLPHTFSDDLKLRMTANNPMAYQKVLYHIQGILRSRAEAAENNENKTKRMLPHYIIFCTDRQIFEKDGIEKYISMADRLGVTFVLMYKKTDRLPNECKMIVECNKDFTGIYDLENKRSESDRIKIDRISYKSADKFAREISRLRVRQFSEGEIPNSIEYLDMIGIGRLEQWDLIKKYKENRPYESLRAFIGIGTGGQPMYLDVHQEKHGPHGLVAGTTGSGKSETLQTFILSLAMNFHPNDVAFALIDFKGAGMAGPFTGMPHIAGVITNLEENGEENSSDTALINRALVSIKSEIIRRQAIFKQLGGINDLDVYSEMYREKKVSEPLPYLVVIADEFAEFKKEHPEHMGEFIRIARVGRNVGVRMILATQKPGGIIDGEIESNSRFRLCLRVQNKQDSMDMLKRPEAAYLTRTGRAYLQVGNDEIFEQFQTGYSGADYEPKDHSNVASEDDIVMVNIDGTPSFIRENKKVKKDNSTSQLKAAVEYINKVCAENGISATRPLWLPSLSDHMVLEEIQGKYNIPKTGICTAYGMIDDPEKQSQFPAIINFSACSKLIISGTAGIGKTTLLQTMLVGLMKNYTCEQVTYYILDFGGRTLKIFSKAPHCGLAAFSDDSESVTRLFGFIDKNIESRKKLFNDANVGSFTEYVKNHSLPLMLVIIDGFFSFSEIYPNMQEELIRITHDCSKYGIQIIITCNHFGDIRYKLMQNFSDKLTLVMAEKGDYREAWGIFPDFMPKNIKGRGMTLCEGRLLEFQAFLPAEGRDESERNSAAASLISEISERDKNLNTAETVPVLPAGQTYSEFISDKSDNYFVPVGYEIKDISVYGFSLKNTCCYAVSDYGCKGITLVLNNISEYAKKIGGEVLAVRLKKEIKLNRNNIDRTYADEKEIMDMFVYIQEIFAPRRADKQEILANDPDGDFTEIILGKYNRVFVIIDSMSEFISVLNDSNSEENMAGFAANLFKKAMGAGVYFIAGFDSGAYNANCYHTPACRYFTSYKNGIHLGGCYDKQKLFDVSMPVSQMSKQRDHFSGLTVIEGVPVNIFVPHDQ